MISYHEIENRDAKAAKLLLLFAYFDNQVIWYELVKNASNSSDVPNWLERAISSGLAFKFCVKTLIAFSLLETKQQEGSYAMHPVVQDWCVHIASTDKNVKPLQLAELVLVSVGHSVPNISERDYTELERRLTRHANAIHNRQYSADKSCILEGFHGLGNLYSDQGKLTEAVEMYQRALEGKEKALGPDHTSTLMTVNNLGTLFSDQGKLKEAEEMYQRALVGYEKALGPDHTSTLDTVNNIGNLYRGQGKLKEAEDPYQGELPDSQKVARLNAKRVRRAIGKFTKWLR
jgi:tetratricopeptide (TPR) repeat protein